MRAALAALLAAYWTACAILYPRLPDRLPIHFNLRGQADRWSENAMLGWFGLPLIATATVALMLGLTALSARRPELWNIPEKQRFLTLTRAQRAPILDELNKVLTLAAFYALAVCVVVQVAIYQNALKASGGLPGVFHVVVWGGLLVLVGYAFRLTGRIKSMVVAASAARVGHTS
jgi:uncharacterized membrane protein